MSRQKLMKTIGIVMIVMGIGIGAFGICMRSTWKVSSQIPKVYDWNTENLGESPDVDNKDVDMQDVESSQSSVGENRTDVVNDNESDDTASAGSVEPKAEEGAGDDE